MFKEEKNKEIPLAERMRPKSLDALIGQPDIWSATSTLFSLVRKNAYNSLIFWGPPGTGKTSLALIIARHSERQFVPMSAVQHGVKDIRANIENSSQDIANGGVAHLVFMDEIHRLNKAQQDVLLPALESGQIKFIGATTENPSFEVNKAILSRCLTFGFKQVANESLVQNMRRVLANPDAELPAIKINDDILAALAQAADGDVRKSLNLMEALLNSCPENIQEIDKEYFKHFSADFLTKYDKDGEQHYDIVSAMIKSIRASHPDAALYYMARMIDAGEDPMFIARRLLIAASEDIGNANPTALLLASSAMQAVHMVGYPEARIVLSQVVTYLASSPKSNRAYTAVDEALADVKALGSLEVPLHLRNAPTQFMKELGYGKLYAYAHSDPKGAKELSYLPDQLAGKRYYRPAEVGVEAQLKKNLEKLRPQSD